MTEIEIIQDLKKKYSNTNLNEADTRFKIIDVILESYLKWPRHKNSVELFINGNRADYVLYNNTSKPVLVIESKKTGVYFELPTSVNFQGTAQKISLEKLITDDNIKEAIFQVKEYCEDLLCNYGAICNGDVWIIFKINSTNQKPWKKLSAYVIKNLDFFEYNFTEAINLLGYTSITQKQSLQSKIGVSKKNHSEIFFPKGHITAYDTIVNSNKYASSFSALTRRYLGIIPESDANFMNSCYVSNKGQYDSLQKNVQGFLHDSLTPYFKTQGFVDFSDNKDGGAFGHKIVKIIKQENLDNVMILFGGRGSGKSTFLKRFLFHIRPIEIDMYARIALVDLINSAQSSEQLTAEIWKKVLHEIDKEKIYTGDRNQILSLFHDEFAIYEKQILNGLEESHPDYQRLLREFIQEKLADTKLFAEKLSLYWKNKNKGLVIFLDNMDQLSTDLQDVSYLTAIEIAKKLSCLVIISMREERFYIAKTKGVLDAYHTPGFHLTAPVIPEVLIKRIEYILDKLKYTADIEGEFNIKSDSELITLENFFKVCLYQLRVKDSHLTNFLRYATHGDVRQALEFFKGFVTSGYTNVDEVAENPYWVFQVHQVIKPMMVPDRVFYDEKLSKIPNILQLRNDVNSSHFTGLRILNLLYNATSSKSPNGFIDAKYFIQEFEERFYLKEDCEHHLNIFMNKGLVESSNRLEEYSEKVDQIKITAFGGYIYDYLTFNFAYLDLVCLDCGIFNEELNNYLVQSANNELKLKQTYKTLDRMILRLERTEKFINYLEEQEQEEIEAFNLDPSEIKFSSRMKLAFNTDKDQIMASAKKNNKKHDK